jgi:cytochrome c-type biogenesis protein CcmE
MRSEKVVVIGHYTPDFFLAEKILLKCPSKYQDNSLKTAGVVTAGNNGSDSENRLSSK